MTNYLLIGGLNPNDNNINRYTVKQQANQQANSRWLWNVINGLEKNGIHITVLNTPNIPSFQEDNSTKFHKGYQWSHCSGAQDYCISFNNTFPFSILSRRKEILKYCKKWIKNTEGEKIIIGITPHYPIVYALNKCSKKAKTCLIVPDLPDYTGTARMSNIFYRLLKKLDIKLFYRTIKPIDYFVILTDNMRNKIGLNKNYLRIECMIDPLIANWEKQENNNNRDNLKIMYSGTIHVRYGIYDVANAIHSSDLKCIFIICGDGPDVERIKSSFTQDDRIQYKGVLKPEDVVKLQRESDVLINPRPNDNTEYLKYSFPSKTLEYLAAAKPVVCHKLPSIPSEYDDHLIYLSDNSKDSICCLLQTLSNMPKKELIEIGNGNRDFVLKSKNYYEQTKKLIEFLEESRN